jgi:hypothetical protein
MPNFKETLEENHFESQFFEDKDKIVNWIKSFCDPKDISYEVNDDFTVSFSSFLYIMNNPSVTNIPFKIRSITDGSIMVKKTGITCIDWLPERIEEYCHLQNNKIKTLKGGPKVASFFNVSGNDLINAVGAPQEGEDLALNFSNCEKLESLKGCPKKVLTLIISGCTRLKDLEYMPPEIERSVFISSNITSLKSLDKKLKKFESDGVIHVDFLPDIEEPMTGLLTPVKIPNFKKYRTKDSNLNENSVLAWKTMSIINEGLSGGKSIFEIQDDIIEAGLEKFI